MIKKIYVFPQTTVNKQFVIAKCLCQSDRGTSYENGSGPGMGGGNGGDGEGNFTKERNTEEYGNIW